MQSSIQHETLNSEELKVKKMLTISEMLNDQKSDL